MDSAEALDRVPPAEAAEAAFLVGIGSSAGGLEALSALLPTLPTGLGLGYLIAQHMSPTHRSMMAQLMGRLTPMTVLEAGNGCRPQADTVLVVPPNHHAVLLPDGSLQLTESPARPAPKPSVNRLFFSLADVLGDRAIGVVLSGTGSDGALGLHAIKAAGGYTFAQEPGGTKYEGMPRAAIEAGGVDWVLPADGIGTEIARLVTRRQSTAEAAGGTGVPGDRLNALLGSLYAHTRIDFHGYKEATLWRRVERRMAANGCADLEMYLTLCRERPSELQALAQDMLISVTAFFRDRPAFERLREALDRLLAVKPAGEDVRIWVAGCASGEEAYSLAICLQEALRAAGQTRRVHLFASDIDENALQSARRGVYPAGLLADLDADWLERYFERHAEGYEVHKAMRSQVMFARHNLVQDAPFARLDLVSCRNVLIYLQPMLQERVLRTFQYALNPGGLLFLGRSEGLHNQDSRFETLDRSAHLFRSSVTLQRLSAPGAEADPPRASPGRARNSLDDLVLRATQERFAPASVLLDLAGEVRHFKGDLVGLMAWPEGRPGFQLMGLLRRELRPEASRLIRSVNEALKAPADGPRRPFGGPPMLGRWRLNQAISSDWALRLSAQPVYDDSGSALILLCFERRPAQELPGGPGSERDEPPQRPQRRAGGGPGQHARAPLHGDRAVGGVQRGRAGAE